MFKFQEVILVAMIIGLFSCVAWIAISAANKEIECREDGGVLLEKYCIDRDKLSDVLIY